MKMAKVLSIANANHVRTIAQPTVRRFMAAPKYTTIASASLILRKPQNPISLRCLSTTSASDQISIGYDGAYNPCIDLFFNVVRPSCYKDVHEIEKKKTSELEDEDDAMHTYLEQLLPKAWSHNPLTTLKLICNLQQRKHQLDCVSELLMFGPSSGLFFTGVHWLRRNHPKTLLCNVEPFAKSFGFYYQLCSIFHHVLAGKDSKEVEEKAAARYKSDPYFKLFHDRVTDVFVDCLKSGVDQLNSKQKPEPSVDAVNNTSRLPIPKTSITESIYSNFQREIIARKMFPRESYPEYQGVEEADYMKLVLDRLLKEVIRPLKIKHSSMMYDEGVHFGFDKYLEEVKAGKSNIVADAWLPHEIICYTNHWDLGKLAELQWKTMVEDMKKKGNEGKKILNNCLVVCDRSGNSNWEPGKNKDVSVGLALLVSELNEEPWKEKVIYRINGTDRSDLKLELIRGEDFRHKCAFLRKMSRSWKGDFAEEVLDLLLQVAVNENVKPEHMIKKILVFGYEYDHESENPFPNDGCWEAKYKAMQRKYEAKGYGDVVPHIVYWKPSQYKPQRPAMPRRIPGATILTGISDDLIKLFLDNGGDIGPEHVMELAISGKEYQSLSVVD